MKFLVVLIALFTGTLNAQEEFSQDHASLLLRVLSLEIGPRPMGSPAERKALEFGVNRFRAFGCDTAYIMPMTSTPKANTTSGIAVGIKHGSSKRIIVVGGHIDSAGPEIAGANDDGSGSAVVMEVARVLGQRQLTSTIVFCLFGGEEQGLRGSRHFVEHFPAIDSVALMLQVDMADGLGIIDIDPDTHGKSAPKWLVRAAIEEFNALGYQSLRYPTHFFSLNYSMPQGSGSDHEAFLEKGIPAIDFSTDVGAPIHTPQDNYSNFDVRGLKRSGDLILALVNRFDKNLPPPTTEQYWLYLVGSFPIFVPHWFIWAFVVVSLAMAMVAFIMLRRRSITILPVSRWSGAKVLLFALIVVCPGWFSSDLVSVIRGLRHPWFTAINSFYVLGTLGSVLGLWIALRLARRIHLSQNPAYLFLRGVIVVVILMAPLALLGPEILVEPASTLFLISLAFLVRSSLLKMLLILCSPWWMLRLIFSEWDGLILRQIGMALGSSNATLALNAVMVPLLLLFILPTMYAGAAAARDSLAIWTFLRRGSSLAVGAAHLVAFLGLALYLTGIPVYDSYWSRDVHIDQRAQMHGSADSLNVNIRSSEFLEGARVRYGNVDTLIADRVTTYTIRPETGFDTSWARVHREFEKETLEGKTRWKGSLILSTRFRPYTVALTVAAGEKRITSFNSPWYFRNESGIHVLEWYSYPDTEIHIPMEFEISSSDTVRETLEVTFDSLAYPVAIELEHSYIIPRTRFVSRHRYVPD